MNEFNKILFVGHDANRAGAQIVLLNWLKYRKSVGLANYLILQDGGLLLPDFQKVAKVWVWSQPLEKKFLEKIPFLKREEMGKRAPSRIEVIEFTRIWREIQPDLIVANTVASLSLLENINIPRVKRVLYVHELAFSLDLYASEHNFNYLKEKVDHIAVVSLEVKKQLINKLSIPEEKFSLLPPFIHLSKEKTNRVDRRLELGIPKDAKVVMGCGLAEWRKGTDIFIRVAKKLIEAEKDVHFIWVGIGNNIHSEEIKLEVSRWNSNSRMHLVPVSSEMASYYEIADVFFLSSREDPYPLVMMEAAYFQLPIIGFKGSGGIEDFNEGIDDSLAENFSETEAKNLLINALKLVPEKRKQWVQRLKQKVENYTELQFIKDWAQIINKIK